ncbi:MAG: hypothetical protein GX896_05715 [Clostridiales bacterium]|nr:hypothetical protein [Clostridiales bacterium]
MFQPSKDLTEIQKILINDSEILSLMGLTTATNVEKAKRIIKRSKYDDLATNEIRLCIFFLPARPTRNIVIHEEVIQIDCHVPYSYDYKAYDIQARIFKLLQRKKINKRYLESEGQLGELSTMAGFFCAGNRYKFNRTV